MSSICRDHHAVMARTGLAASRVPHRSRHARRRCVAPSLTSCCGLTLIEMLIASTIGLVTVLAFSVVDMGHFFLTVQVRQDAGMHTEVAFAIAHMVKRFELADQVNVITTDNVQFRVPLADDLDNALNYNWGQYRYDGGSNTVTYYGQTEDGCTAYLLSEDITNLTISYANESNVPPGGEPVGLGDNNILSIAITLEDPVTLHSMTLRGEAAIRAGAYTNLMTGLSTVLPPPAVCP